MTVGKPFLGAICLAFVAACQSTLVPPESRMVLNAELEPQLVSTGKTPLPPSGAVPSLEVAARNIEAREIAYKQVVKDAKANGMFGGAVRGAVIGLLIENSAAGVVAGAVVGGAIGAAVGEKIGANVIQDHRNFLVREASLQRVISAAKQDTSETSFDLLLSSELRDAVYAETPTGTDFVAQSLQKLQDFRKFALIRTVALRELLPLYDSHPEAQKQLSAELVAQNAMISKYDQNIRLVEGKGQ